VTNGPRIVRIEPGEQLLIGDDIRIRLLSDWVRGVTLELETELPVAVDRRNPRMLMMAMQRRRGK